MDIWHATVFYHGSAYDEDCIGQDAAKTWAEGKLRNLGYTGPVRWECTDTQCSANQSPDNTAVIRRRAQGQPQPSRSQQLAREDKTAEQQPAAQSSNYVQQLWRGQVPLPVTFWLWGIGVNFVVTLLFTFGFTPGTLIVFLYLGYYAFIVVAIWRSSERYQGPRVWAALARISVMLGVIQTVLALVQRT